MSQPTLGCAKASVGLTASQIAADGSHRGPQAGRGRRAPVRWRRPSAARVPAPPSTPCRTRPGTRWPKSSPPASSRPAPSRTPAPTRCGLIFPSPRFGALAVLQLRPPRPGPRLPGRGTAPARGPGTAARVLHHRPVHLEARRHRRVPHATTASPSTCTSAPPPACSTAPATPPDDPDRPR